MTVYKITNKINGKAYIGQTVGKLETRWYQHNQVNSKSNYCKALKAALIKYGKDNFTVEVLTVCSSRQELNWSEEYFIDHYQTFGENGYNLTSGGDSRIPTAESNRLRSEKLKGRPRHFKNIELTREKMSKAKMGKSGNPTTQFKKGNKPWNTGKTGTYTTSKGKAA